MDDFFEDDYDDDFMDEEPDTWGNEPIDENPLEDTDTGDEAGPGWHDIAIIGGMCEDIAREKREKERIIRENDSSDDDYWDIIDRSW